MSYEECKKLCHCNKIRAELIAETIVHTSTEYKYSKMSCVW